MTTKFCFSLGALTFLCALDCFSQGTAFTYQGRLNAGGSPANGTYDLRFILYNADPGGSQQGPILTNAATAVSNGLFTVALDFGNQFPGADRWLEIGVRTNGGGTFTTLSPRQKITPTPYAVASANLIGTLPTSQLTGTIGSSQLADNSVTSAKILDGEIVNGDINAAAAIADTKLATIATAGKVSDTALSANVTKLGSSIDSAEITDNTIVNADINAAAAIADTKLATISTAGKVANSATTATNANIANTIVARDAAGKFGAGGIGIGTNSPLAALHIVNNGVSPSSSALNGESLVVGATDASLGLFSPNVGTYGSAITLKEIQADGSIADTWGLLRKSSGGSSDFQLTYGTNVNYAANPVLLSVRTNGAVGIGTASPTDALLDIEGNARLNNNNLYLRDASDRNHGLGWYGSGKLFDGVTVDGPVLFGYGGGALGSADILPNNIALRWTAVGNVGIGTNSPQAKLHVNGDVILGGSVGIGTNAQLRINGDVKLGTNGQFFAAAGDANLRIIEGSVFANGSTFVNSSGFTATNTSPGVYRINFNVPFVTHSPAVIALPLEFGSSPKIATSSGAAFDYAEINVWTLSGSLTNSGFLFIAVGPK